jgi:Helix-turn-helix domain
MQTQEKQENTKQHAPKLALTREEAGEALGISAVTVDRLAKRGLLRPSRATRRPLYPVWEIERFLRETTAALTP